MSNLITGDIRYEVSFCPRAHGEKIRAEDETAWPGDYCFNRRFSDFRDAARFAIVKAKDDWFGMTQLRRYVCEDAKYDWWEDTGLWEVDSDCSEESLDPDKPTQ